MPISSQSAHTNARELLSLLDIEKIPEEQENKNKAVRKNINLQHGEWGIFFIETSYSNREARALLPTVLETFYSAPNQSTEDWHDPSELPH